MVENRPDGYVESRSRALGSEHRFCLRGQGRCCGLGACRFVLRPGMGVLEVKRHGFKLVEGRSCEFKSGMTWPMQVH